MSIFISESNINNVYDLGKKIYDPYKQFLLMLSFCEINCFEFLPLVTFLVNNIIMLLVFNTNDFR